MNKIKSEIAKTNFFLFSINAIIDIGLIGGYGVEVIKGTRTVGYVAFFALLVLINLLSCIIPYIKNRDNANIKYINLFGYSIVYAFALFTSVKPLTYAYIFPIFIVYILYFDYKLVFIGMWIIDILNVLKVVQNYLGIGQEVMNTSADTTNYLVQILSVGIFAFAMLKATGYSNSFSDTKKARVKEEQEKNTSILNDVLNISKTTKDNASLTLGIIDELNDATIRVNESVDEISIGNQSNAESIEKQTMMTTHIQSAIDETKSLAEAMSDNTTESLEAIQAGKKSIDEVVKESELIVKKNAEVSDVMNLLVDNTKEVSKITEQIFSISSQTNLLALNASIESARAGEAGRGFAVVADQIRILADETRKLTENITKLVGDLGTHADSTKVVVDDVVSSMNSQNEKITNSQKQFGIIEKKVNVLSQDVTSINNKVSNLVEANNTIVESISQISAVSQEVNAGTLEVVELGEFTKGKAEEAKKLMEDLTNTIELVDKYI